MPGCYFRIIIDIRANLLSAFAAPFIDGKNAGHFAPVINDTDRLIVSTINIYEVYKKVISERNEDDALQAIAMMGQAKVIEVTASIALQAAKISYLFKLPMADCLIYITAREQNAIVGTQDADFKDLEGEYSTFSPERLQEILDGMDLILKPGDISS